MAKFLAAFEQGQEAAQSAALANAEIDCIFQELTEELLSASEGKLEVSIRKPVRNTISTLWQMATGGAAATDPSIGASEDLWICATNPAAGNSAPVKIARLERPYEGYPCQIQYGKSDVRCNDGVALAAALKDMLANAWVAHELREVMIRPPKPQSSEVDATSPAE